MAPASARPDPDQSRRLAPPVAATVRLSSPRLRALGVGGWCWSRWGTRFARPANPSASPPGNPRTPQRAWSVLRLPTLASTCTCSRPDRDRQVHLARRSRPGRSRCRARGGPLARSCPVRRCPDAADHRDPVMTSHPPDSKPGWVDRVVKENDGPAHNRPGPPGVVAQGDRDDRECARQDFYRVGVPLSVPCRGRRTAGGRWTSDGWRLAVMGENYRGLRVGDRVRVEVPAEVIEIGARDGVPGVVVVVAVAENAGAVWVPVDRAVLLAGGRANR